MVNRVRDLHIIKVSHNKQLMIELSKCCRCKNESQSFPAEEKYRFRQLVFHAFAEEYISESKSAELMKVSQSESYLYARNVI
jgi:hypothetical protein